MMMPKRGGRVVWTVVMGLLLFCTSSVNAIETTRKIPPAQFQLVTGETSTLFKKKRKFQIQHLVNAAVCIQEHVAGGLILRSHFQYPDARVKWKRTKKESDAVRLLMMHECDVAVLSKKHYPTDKLSKLKLRHLATLPDLFPTITGGKIISQKESDDIEPTDCRVLNGPPVPCDAHATRQISLAHFEEGEGEPDDTILGFPSQDSCPRGQG